MSRKSLQLSDNTLKALGWAEIVVYLSDLRFLDEDKMVSLLDKFSGVRIAAQGERPKTLPAEIGWYSYSPEDHRSAVWNRLLHEAKKDWVLFIEDDEEIRYGEFPDIKCIEPNLWPPALILSNGPAGRRQYYQIRLVRKESNIPFEGKNLPDCTAYVTSNNINLAGQPIVIDRKSDPVQYVDPDDELSIQAYSPKLYLVRGEQLFGEGKYAHAAALYRKLLKTDKLLPFDRLGAVNGLASCYTEQFKWEHAVALAQKSIEAEPLQRLPYLIQFKIFQLNKQWKEAFEVLNRYYGLLNLWSRATFDRTIDEEETLLNLAELALKAGVKDKATEFMEKLYNLKEGDLDDTFVHRLLLLSIELSDYERSVFFFRHLFGSFLPDRLTEEKAGELDDFMTMFISKGWYEYVAEIYETLYRENPQNADYKRRLIVALSKTNKLGKARKLVAGK